MLLVDDDESDNNGNPASGKLSASDVFYRKLLQDRSLAFDTVVVSRYADGPPPDKLKAYSMVVWYTGASYGGNRDNTAVISLRDEQTLTRYLADTGGAVLLFSPGYLNNALGAGGVALWSRKDAPFLQQVLGIKGGRGLLQRFNEASVVSTSGASFVVGKSPTVEIQFSAVNPDKAQTLFTATLDPDGKGARAVAVAAGQAVGTGHFVYVGFTFENIAAGASEAFGKILSAAGVPVASATAGTAASSAASSTATPGAAQADAAFAPKRVRTDRLTLTGTGQLNDGPQFVPKRVRTDAMTVSGTGRLSDGPPFVPQSVRTPVLSVSGTGSLQ